MPDLPPDDILGTIRRHLGAPTPGEQSAAIEAAIDYADQAAQVAWDAAPGQPPLARLLLALQAAAEELEGIGTALAGGDQDNGTEGA